ncbi:hypothetical protein DIURU_004184 [Diutina rugosa]|uniref:Uncharacterized protein n=1 Tax=Diutina rugosa TaxID=5481 RepID=A0A642UKM1_DIURU|nr:uncharacterized protein DIURU_004184 [Diutina rugosa]KAA8899701.1 hypothetical protein DIURU_004184 [Diutina rugosa]
MSSKTALRGTLREAQGTEDIDSDLRDTEASVAKLKVSLDAQKDRMEHYRAQLEQQERVRQEWRKEAANIRAQARQKRAIFEQLTKQLAQIRGAIARETRYQQVVENAEIAIAGDDLSVEDHTPQRHRSVDLTSITSRESLVSEASLNSHNLEDIIVSRGESLTSVGSVSLDGEAIEES